MAERRPPSRPAGAGCCSASRSRCSCWSAVFLGDRPRRAIPSTLPSALVGKPAPDFSLPPLDGPRRARASAARTSAASRCWSTSSPPGACRAGSSTRSSAAWPSRASTVQGINYKDQPADAKAWLAELGDPFAAHRAPTATAGSPSTGACTACPRPSSSTSDGRIAYRQVGPIQPQDLERTILPLLEKLK